MLKKRMDELLELNDNPIDSFTSRFGAEQGHLEMAYHAALPLALTPDLLYLIWANFRLDAKGDPLNMQWVTVADLILSSLCREIRHETYVMETAVRQKLLDRMAKDERFGPDYILRLGQFIQHYASQYIQSDIPSLRQYAQAQQWAAQAYTEPDRLIESLANEYSHLPNEAQTMRLAELLNTFSEPLNLDWVPTLPETAVNYDRLHTFGDGLAKFVRGDRQTATRQLRRLLGPTHELHIGTMVLPVPTAVSQALASQEEKIYTYRVRVQGEDVHTLKLDENEQIIGESKGKLHTPELEQTVEEVLSTGIDATGLSRLLTEHFSLFEFEGLISSLDVETEMLTSTPSVGGRIREAVMYLRRRQRLDELFNLAREARPNVDWSRVAQTQTTQQLTTFATLLQTIQTNQADENQLRQFGQLLFATLFDNELQTDFLRFYETAVMDNAFIRLELEISQPDQNLLLLLPWELLCLPNDTGFGTDWLAAAPEIMLARRPSRVDPSKPAHLLPANNPLRIALVVGPQTSPELPNQHEPIWQAYHTLASRYPNQFELLPLHETPTSDSLEELLARQPDFVHFLVNSQLSSRKGRDEGQIILIRNLESQKPVWISADELVLASPTDRAAIILLQSSNATESYSLKGLQDVAAVLSEAEVPAVLSWQFPVENTAVATFIHTVFPALAQGIPLDEAVQNGRRALLGDKNPLAFAAPSLFANAVVRRRTTSEPVPPTLPHSLSVSVAGRNDLVFLLRKGQLLPTVSESITLRDEHTVIKASETLAYQGILLFQGESTTPQENILLGEILLDDEALYKGILEIEAEVAVDSDNNISFSINHQNGFSRELTLTFQDEASNTVPQVINFQATIERYTRGVSTAANLPNFMKIDTWLSNSNASRVLIFTGENGAGKTTIAAQLAQFFLGETQPPNNLMGLAVTSTSASYFCEPFAPRTLDPRSFALTIASQWAKRDSHFRYLQSTVDNHEDYELDELVELLLIRPFTDIDELIYPGSIVFLVDDLEAALQHPGETTIVDLILRMLREVYGVRFLLTAQMQPAVRSKLADVEAEFIYLGDRYDNFDIHIGQPLPGPEQRYPLVVSSETSGQLQDIEQTFAPVTELGYERLARLRDLASNPEEVIEIGQRLFRVLMREPNYEMVRRSLATARERGKEGLRLRVQFEDPSLQSYPWELCHDGHSFIFNNPDQPILLTRTVGVENVQTPPPLPRPVRLLVAIAGPVDQGRADVEMQEKVIREATDELVTSSELDLQILRHATLGDVASAAQSYQPSLVQFINHSSGEKEGSLFLEGSAGRSNIVPVSEIMQILAPAPVQCVILSPIGVGETAVTQLAPQFIQQGIPTVLAEQFVLPDQPAIEFWRAFYRALLFDRLSFEEAVWNGRTHLATIHREPFWSHVTLFAETLEKTAPTDFPENSIDEPDSLQSFPQNPSRLFISHAAADSSFAQQLATDLKANGQQIWMIPDNFQTGERWVDSIKYSLQESEVFLLVVTPHALDSNQVQQQVAVAIELEFEKKIKLLLLHVEKTEIPTLWQPYQSLSFLEEYQVGLRALLKALETLA